MSHPGIVSFSLLVGALLAVPFNLLAQTTAQPAVGTPLVTALGESCPVDLQAQRHGTAGIVVTKGDQPAPINQQLRLDWANRLQKEIVAAAIVIHGFDASPRIIPAGSHVSPELKKVVAVKLNIAGDGRASTDLAVQHFATISFVELKSIEYADGTRWSAPVKGSCRITLNPLLLVAATATR